MEVAPDSRLHFYGWKENLASPHKKGSKVNVPLQKMQPWRGGGVETGGRAIFLSHFLTGSHPYFDRRTVFMTEISANLRGKKSAESNCQHQQGFLFVRGEGVVLHVIG